MHHRPLLAEIDLVARKQARPPLAQPGRLGQINQQTQGGVVDALLGKIHQQAFQLQRKTLETLRVGRKQVAQMRARKTCLVRNERLPGGGIGIGHTDQFQIIKSHQGRAAPHQSLPNRSRV
jgi:hypothetical protein